MMINKQNTTNSNRNSSNLNSNNINDPISISDKNWIGSINNSKIANNDSKNIHENKFNKPNDSISSPNNNQFNNHPDNELSNSNTNNKDKETHYINQNLSKLSSVSKSSMSKKSNQSPLVKLANSLYRNDEPIGNTNGEKNPIQLMNDIFRGIGINHLSNAKAYYSRQTQNILCELLSNKTKMNNYLKKLSSQMNTAPSEVEKNYQILYILMQQLGDADLQVHQDQNGVKLHFNRSELNQKQVQIQRLQKQLQQKNKQTQKIVQQYQAVIRNFNDVIQKLIQQKKH